MVYDMRHMLLRCASGRRKQKHFLPDVFLCLPRGILPYLYISLLASAVAPFYDALFSSYYIYEQENQRLFAVRFFNDDSLYWFYGYFLENECRPTDDWLWNFWNAGRI